MELNSLTAISPIDGRYRKQLAFLDQYFSEYALMKYRVKVEVLYFIFLSNKKFFKLSNKTKQNLLEACDQFSLQDALEIKETEAITNHDVKAVEYFVKNIIKKNGEGNLVEWVHFGLTSQDINNTAIPKLLKHFFEYEYLPTILNLQNQINQLAKSLKHVTILAKTHGQPASPTILGKEMMVFVERLQHQIHLLAHIPFTAKFGGATGNFNAHHVAFPEKKWIQLANDFVEKDLELQRLQFTTQIEHYDYLAAQCHAIVRINTILIDFCRDIWTYVSMDYFKQKTKANEVGSSAMPHKVNPIDFENAEGNLGIANALFEHLAAKLPISRLQRDLTDSTVLRNIGVPFAHSVLAIFSIKKGIDKLIVNEVAIQKDLDNNWAVVAEAIQTILRRENYPNPYEALKQLTRGKDQINKTSLHEFINGLKVSKKVKDELKKITPYNYTGVSSNY
ncbi:MAG: adenylosuccinate lyase [Chitinophagaceae bacterium]|nr:adenylosuccinate lyase [Chitinophagaceae bacterium]